MPVKLGKAPVQAHRYLKVPRMATYLAPIVTPPVGLDFTTRVKSWPMMKNDTVGDCTCACYGHMVQEWTTDNEEPYVPSDTAVIGMYSAITGYKPGDDSTDNGAACIDVLNYCRTTGLSGHKILGYASVDPQRVIEVQASIYLFGAMYLGVQLPVSVQDKLMWTVPDGGPVGNGAPGSWGGHAIPVMAYDSQTLTCITWGKTLKMSWAFFEIYCDEAYAVLSQDWIAKSGLSPSSFDLVTLQKDLASV